MVCCGINIKVNITNKIIPRAQSFTSLMADLRQDINRGFAFSRCLNGTFPLRPWQVNSEGGMVAFVTLLIWVIVSMS